MSDEASSRARPLVIGLDVGGTHVQAGVVTQDGVILARAHRPTTAETDEAIDATLDGIAGAARDACMRAGVTLEQIAAIGVAAAGAIDAPRGVVHSSPNLGWTDLPLRDLLAERLARPVALENDVNAAALGEWHAAGRGRDMLGVWAGTGVGGGLILQGRIHHGAQHTAGEIGHVIIEPDGAPGKRTVEDLCSRRGLRSVIAAAGYASAESLTAQGFAEAWRARDPIVAPAVDRAAELLGTAIANVVTLLAIDHVVIGGGMSEALGAPWIEAIAASFARDVFPKQLRSCRIEMTTLASDAGILGAARVAAQVM